MPPTDLGHGDSSARPRRPAQHRDGNIVAGAGKGEGMQTGEGRKAIPIAVEDGKHSLSPLIDTLPALPNLSSLRTFLPTSPPPATQDRKTTVSASEASFSKWQSADLRDGRGRQNLLLFSTPECALRVFRVSGSEIPADPQVVKEILAPEEVFRMAHIKRDSKTRKSQLGIAKQGGVGKEVVVSAQVVERGDLAEEHGPMAFILTSKTTNRHALAESSLLIVSLRAGLAVREVELGSGKCGSLDCSARAIAIGLADSIHLLHPSTLLPFHSITNPAISTFTLSGRLLAFATDEAPRFIGPSGLGTLITAASSPRARVASEGAERPLSPSSTGAIVSSAISIGGGVARGVWAGIKMGAQAAHQANAARLAKSAPIHGSILADEETLSESKSKEDFPAEGVGGAGWIKILDLGRLPSVEVDSPTASSTPAPANIKTIAHFRVPQPKPDLTQHSTTSSIATLSWNADGTQLLAAPEGGRVSHVFQIHPSTPGSRASGDVLHLYELNRGSTAAKVQEVVWDKSGRWVGVASERGTILTRTTAKIGNPTHLHSLSQSVESSARLRHHHTDSADHAIAFSFGRWQQHPLDGTFCQDISTFRPSLQVIELQRLSVKNMAVASPRERPSSRKGSGITEMMWLKGAGDLAIEHVVKARWKLPNTEHDLQTGSDNATRAEALAPLANAEIRTYSINPRILPSTVYLSHQVDFFSARIDDSPHSIIAPDARVRRIKYRNEVQVKSSTSSFNEPLSTALHSRMESPARSEIPGLPNLPPTTKWRSIPVRTVAGVGEGLDRVRQTYVKTQAIRRHRRANEHLANGLSFEEGAIFASSPTGLGLDPEHSSPSSVAMPVSDSAVEDDEEWAEGWEDEYRHAVEVEGEPDDLVLGVMDEEEDERRVALAKGQGRTVTLNTRAKGG